MNRLSLAVVAAAITVAPACSEQSGYSEYNDRQRAFCDDMTLPAYEVMVARQLEAPRNDLLKGLSKTVPEEAQRTITETIIEMAYLEPVHSKVRAKFRAAFEFDKQMHSWCLRHIEDL